MKKLLMALVILTGLTEYCVLQAAELYGVVTDKNMQRGGIKVILKFSKVEKPLETETDTNGVYSFKNIDPISYIVTVGDNKNRWKIFVGPGRNRRDFSLK